MKKLVALLAVLSYVPFAHAAEGDWSHNGEFRLQYDGNDNFDNNDKANDHEQTIHQRTKLGTTVRGGEKMTFNLGIVHNADWGSNPTQTPDSITAANNLLTVNEANMVWQASDVMTWKFGRISHTIADGSVVGANTWENVQKAFDGAGLVYEFEPVRVTGFGVTGAKGSEANQFGRFFGVSADFKTLPAFLKMANVHYIVVKRDAALGGDYPGIAGIVDSEDSTRTGFTVGGDTAGFDYKATYAMYSGESKQTATATKKDIEASMWDVEVGYSMPEVMNLHVYAGMHSDSGSKATDTKLKTYNPFHYEAHENAGLMDILGWGNLTYNRVGAKISPQDDITVALEYLMFTKTEKTGASYGAGGYANLGVVSGDLNTNANASTAAKDDLGNEIDLTVSKKYTNNFGTSLSYRMFQFGDAFGSSVDDASQIYAEAKLTF